ncbi:MAG: DoxX family protein [Betaproteobacteria bacterium]|nr:DoxX family protein [Betaproteobacteria bacterium]
MSESTQNFLQLLGRVLLSVIFIVAGIRKALSFAASVAYMAKNGVPLTEPLAVAAIALEIGGGLMLLFGWKTRYIAIVLAIFVAVITPIFHAFWTFEAAALPNQLNHFLKNLCVIGGMLYVAVSGPGKYSIDGNRK